MTHLPNSPRFPLRPRAAASIAIFGLAPMDALAVQMVKNCNDDGADSLREALANAAEGELIDATGLALVCSKISLTSNPLIVANNAQTIAGPGSDKLTIDGTGVPDAQGIFFHNGTGTLEIDDVTVTNGNKYLNSTTVHDGGGCIYSQGSVKLDHVVVTNCTMTAGPNSHARGGAIYANGYVTLTQSTVSGGVTHGASPFGYEMATDGGGIFAKGAITLDHSTVSSSHAINGGGIYTQLDAAIYSSTISDSNAQIGGGIWSSGSLQMIGSTLSNNTAEQCGALNVVYQGTVAKPSFIRNSTITGNTISAAFSAAAGEIGVPITISNSTIAFNTGLNTSEGALYGFGGSLTLESSIIAGNYPLDVDVQSGTLVHGAANLSPASRAGIMPGDTKLDCPLLEPLANTGGPTATLALKHNSPAIDFGNNLLSLTADQRGNGFPRPFGIGTDIGAWEWQGGPDNNIFHDGFETPLGACHN
jgi:hypothetical protein